MVTFPDSGLGFVERLDGVEGRDASAEASAISTARLLVTKMFWRGKDTDIHLMLFLHRQYCLQFSLHRDGSHLPQQYSQAHSPIVIQ